MSTPNYIKIFVINAPVNMEEMICDVLRGEGFDAWPESESRSFLEADVLFMMNGSCQLPIIDEYIKQKGRKPVTILWMTDPLLPPEMPAEAEKIGLSIVKMDWRKVFNGKLGVIFQKKVPLARVIFSIKRYILSCRINKILVRSGLGKYVACTREWERIMARYETFLNSINNNLFDFVFTTTIAKHKYLASKGINSDFVPVGYNLLFGEDLKLHRDIDVLFLGRMNNPERNKILNDLSKTLGKKNINLRIVDGDCYGQQRTELLNRAKISIDLPRVPWDFGIERFIMSMSCGSLLVSSFCEDAEPLIKDVHYVAVNKDNFASKIIYYIENESERKKIIEMAYEFVTTEMTLQKSIHQIINKVIPCIK